MIIVTGGGGFIGSALIWQLNQAKIDAPLVVVDRLGCGDKWRNLVGKDIAFALHKDLFFNWLEENSSSIEAVFHMGACSTTTETDTDYLMENNVNFSRRLFQCCAQKQIPFIYASSAATYGALEKGFSDRAEMIPSLHPINKYGFSKQLFDCWVLKQKTTPPFWAGLKFFNVYGPNEYHKGAQASVVFHAFNQIKACGRVKLFRSHRPEYADGLQMRDFVYVKDVVKIILHLYQNRHQVTSGIFNIGTGTARSFFDLVKAVFSALSLKEEIDWIDMPEALKNQYQYFTQADISHLRTNGLYKPAFFSLEEGVKDYVTTHLTKAAPYL